MSSGTFNIGLSALLAAQQGLSTAGHNIANVNTPGFSRQRVTFEAREPQFIGAGFVGKGVDTQSITRIANQFLIDQVRLSNANVAQATKTSELLEIIDRQIGDALVNDSIEGLFASLADASDDPSLMPTRRVLLERAQSMVSRVADQEEQFNALSRSVNQQMAGTIDSINALTSAIARINLDISRGAGLASGEPPNDLLDKRDLLLTELSEHVAVELQTRSDNMVNVVVGDGTLVVTGGSASTLVAVPNSLDASRVEIGLAVGGTVSEITSSVSGGALGAMIEFRDDYLEPSRNAIGRLAASVAMIMNEQHRDGMDLNGNLGADLFSIPAPNVNSLAGNTGVVNVAFDAANVNQLTTSDYHLTHDGTNLVLTRLQDNNVQNLSGAGPFNVDGLSITLATPPVAGDEFLIQPTKYVPRGMTVNLADPAAIALAQPVRTRDALANIGDASISRAEVLDVTDAQLLTTTTLVFADPPSGYQVNGVGAVIPFTSGNDIDINGWRVQINGQPRAGDSFVIESNVGGVGDNTNGLALGGLQFSATMAGGTASFQEAYGLLLGDVGAAANQVGITLNAMQALYENAEASRDALSAVNLDEEAANLLKFQQAYQAAAQVIATADAVFQSLIDAARG